MTGCAQIADLLPAGTVKITEHLGVFEKRVAFAHAQEFVTVEKKIVDTGPFAGPGFPGCIRDRKFQIRSRCDDTLDEGGFSGPGWRGDYKQFALLRGQMISTGCLTLRFVPARAFVR